jgi:hypothetical protein
LPNSAYALIIKDLVGDLAPAVGEGASQQKPLESKEIFLPVRTESGGVPPDMP